MIKEGKKIMNQCDRLRCNDCGKFVSKEKIAKHIFIPDSEVSQECEYIQCILCYEINLMIKLDQN